MGRNELVMSSEHVVRSGRALRGWLIFPLLASALAMGTACDPGDARDAGRDASETVDAGARDAANPDDAGDTTDAGDMTDAGDTTDAGDVDAGPAPTGIIFETNFENDADYYVTRQGLATFTNVPEGFDGALVTADGYIRGMAGEGVGGSVALWFMWDPNFAQPVAQLYKHLTGDAATGYDELYIRYNVRLPNRFKVGRPDYDPLPYWKWGRLWQNTGVMGSGWTENRVDSYYAVWNFGGSLMWGADAGGTFGANTGANLDRGSAGGERYSNDYYTGTGDYSTHPGHFQAVGGGAWRYDGVSRMLVNNTSQTWHTIEWRFRLSTSDTSGDGVFEMWFDGVPQTPVDISGSSGSYTYAPPLAASANPTARHGSGYNMLVMFDNINEWHRNWDDADAEGGIYVNDLVVSSDRIGHAYVVR